MNKNAMRNLGTLFATFNTVWLLAASNSRAADFLGASRVLRVVEERHAKPAEKPATTNDVALLKADLKTFSQTETNLSAEDSAQQWLALMDRAAKLQSQAGSRRTAYADAIDANEVLRVLPPPTTWAALAKTVAARPPAKEENEMREIGLHFLTAYLTGDTNAQSQTIASLSAKVKTSDSESQYNYRNYLDRVREMLLKQSANPEVVFQTLDHQLDAAVNQGPQQINVPNLVAQVGAVKAEAFLRKALLVPNVILQFEQASETTRLAQRLARELMGQIKSPQWSLINSLDALDLYEAMDQKFGTSTNGTAKTPIASVPGLPDMADDSDNNDSGPKSQAQIYYLLGLISKSRTADAVVIAKKINGRNGLWIMDQAMKEMEHAGFSGALDDFFHELLSQNPGLPFWDQYVEIAAHAGKTARMVTLVRTSIDHGDMSASKRAGLQQILFKALLAADNVDEGVQEIRRLASQDEAAPAHGNYNAGQLGMILARIGYLLQKPELTEEGIGLAKKWLAKPADQNASEQESSDVAGPLVQLFMDLNRGPEAEAVLTDQLTKLTTTNAGGSHRSWDEPTAPAVLMQLALLYHQAGRYEDVVNLLEQSPDWGVGDLSDLFSSSTEAQHVELMFLHTGSSPMPVTYLAANALLATGRKEAAQKLVIPLQDRFPGLDRCYELLIALQGTNAIPQLDAWYQRDQFEERPLIWKAHLLRQESQLEAAEKTIRQAISIDPSDGEEGRGDRMRAYAELAEIGAARGDQKEADFYHEVVKAIRLSEDADQYYQAGLLKRAISMYEKGLDHFADAYCIQSRLAIQLSALGKNEEAEEHYRRAFELMPDSFGRVESHCFGCERAFDGERAQNMAEQVFIKFSEEHPNKPQVHYLLGYLRQEQERFSEARTNFLRAVRLDPDYLNAWVKLQEASDQVLVSARDRDETTFNILRLDPLGRHGNHNLGQVSDLAGLWQVANVAVSWQLPPAGDLFSLKASKLALDKKKEASPEDSWREQMRYSRGRMGFWDSPAAAVAQTSFVQLAGQMIMGGSGYGYSSRYSY